MEISPLNKVFDLTGGTGCNRQITDGEVTDMAGLYDERKTQVLECSRWLSENGFFGTLRGTGGNISVRVPGEDLLVVTPSTRRYDTMKPEDICVVDFDLKAADGGKLKPSMETPMHIAIYRNRQDVNAVVHTHQIYGSVFALINTPIPALFDEAASSIGNLVEVVPYGLSGSGQLLENVVSKLSNRANCYIMQNHGVLALGIDLARAKRNAELLEKCARVYCYALGTGREVTVIPENIQEILRKLMTMKQDAEIERKKVKAP